MTNRIILDICKRHRIEPEDFFGPTRHETIVQCRIEAVTTFRGMGMSLSATARLMKRSWDTIRYWLDSRTRERRRAYMLNRWHTIYKHEARV